jgi:hypothetical protein
LWKKYFGPEIKIYAIDINPECKSLEEENVTIFIGDQEDRVFLRSLKEKIPKVDILIDDGGHTMRQQVHTFEELFNHIKDDGIYLCEDLHTSYWSEFGGGYKRKDSFIEYSKNFIDHINAYHSRQPDKHAINQFTKRVHSLHYYDSMLIIEKRLMNAPYTLKKGQKTIQTYYADQNLTFFDRLKTLIIKLFG